MPVQLATFNRWGVSNYIGVVIQKEDDGRVVVSKVWRKTCSRHIAEIVKDPKIRGQARMEIQRYVEGTTFVTKHSVTRHMSSQVNTHDKEINYIT
jgi:hypothetical protein